jgi:purine-binding chemotaxis protein CheW
VSEPRAGSGALRRYCTFYLGAECFALELSAVREIRGSFELTPVRGAPPAVRGLASVRGQIATVIDPRVWLGDAPAELAADGCLVVLAAPGPLVGLSVERIDDVIALADDSIEPVPAALRESPIAGIARRAGEPVRILALAQGLR